MSGKNLFNHESDGWVKQLTAKQEKEIAELANTHHARLNTEQEKMRLNLAAIVRHAMMLHEWPTERNEDTVRTIKAAERSGKLPPCETIAAALIHEALLCDMRAPNPSAAEISRAAAMALAAVVPRPRRPNAAAIYIVENIAKAHPMPRIWPSANVTGNLCAKLYAIAIGEKWSTTHKEAIHNAAKRVKAYKRR
jgi:hypothetical protein